VYSADRLGVGENNIGNGNKIKAQKQLYEVSVYEQRLM
jgi:hypothetical protein